MHYMYIYVHVYIYIYTYVCIYTLFPGTPDYLFRPQT